MYRNIVVSLAAFMLITTLSGAEELEVLRRRYLEAKPHALRATTQIGAKLPLRLFDDAQYTATLASIEDDPLNGFVWRGRLDGTVGGWVVMVEEDGCMAGTVLTGESYFRIRCLGNRLHAIEELVPPEPVLDDALEAYATEFETFTTETGTAESFEESEIVELDVLVVFTRKAAKKLFLDFDTGFSRAKQAMKAEIRLAMAVANTVLENSEIPIRLRLVKARPIGYTASGDSSYDLGVLRRSDDGIIDKVHVWRDRYGADFVSMVLDDFEPDYNGRGYLVPPQPDADRWMFNVVNWDALGLYTLVHEIGHNMGLAHDRDNDTSQPDSKAFRYSHGYRDPDGGFRTVMSYRDGCEECRWRIPHFSNRQVRWQGAPTGNPDFYYPCGDGVSTGPECGRRTGDNRADCARSLANTRDFYAQARPCRVRCGS